MGDSGMADPRIFDHYALFIFDADDTLRRTTVPGKPCPHAPSEWELLPRVRETLSSVTWGSPGNPQLGVASNQDQVGYGRLSMEMAGRLLHDLALAATGTEPEAAALQLCPHTSESGCDCRKPKPGMLVSIMRHYRVVPGDTVFIGNHESDREAAANAGTAFIWAADFFAGGD
jgi:D-glycero-D-manno-heptose 1,7-bisphosphate phosphatase